MKTLFSSLIYALLFLVAAVSCIEDGYDTSPSAQPTFSVDTLDMGLNFTDQATPTHKFTVYNRHSKILSISNISLRSGGKTFRLNVDGFAGESFSNIEIRPNDSIYVFVEATLPADQSIQPTDVSDIIDFTTNGVQRSVVVTAQAQNVVRLRGCVIDSDERMTSTLPYQIYDSLVVAKGATLTLAPGVDLRFHSGAKFVVHGTLVAEGTVRNPINMTGDRTDNVVADISFDLMASQWYGLTFEPESRGNRLVNTVVRNTEQGVVVDSLAQLTAINSRLRNSAAYALVSRYADVTLIGTEVAEASAGLFAMMGGTVTANHCTFANYYLFSALYGASLQFYHYSAEADNESGMPYLKADFSNSIVYGNGTDLSAGDFTGCDVYFRNCLLKSDGEDDDNFIKCLWGEDPLYGTVREEYYFDYRLKEDSEARTWADPALTLPEAATDPYGETRTTVLGAYEQVWSE